MLNQSRTFFIHTLELQLPAKFYLSIDMKIIHVDHVLLLKLN